MRLLRDGAEGETGGTLRIEDNGSAHEGGGGGRSDVTQTLTIRTAQQEEQIARDALRPGGVDGSRSLSMPPPQSIPRSYSHRHVSATQREIERQHLGGTIQHRNTRLRGAFVQDTERGLSSSSLSVRTPTGLSPVELPHTPSSYADSDMESVVGDGQRVGGKYRTVAMTPSPHPDSLTREGQRDFSPLLTWGEICGTPVALEAAYMSLATGNDSGSDVLNRRRMLDEICAGIDMSGMSDSFHMSGPAPRETLAHQLEEKARSKKKIQQQAQQARKDAERARLLQAATPLGGRTPGTPSALPSSSQRSSRQSSGKRTPQAHSTPLTPAGLALAQKLAASSALAGGGTDRLGLGGVLRGGYRTSEHHTSHKRTDSREVPSQKIAKGSGGDLGNSSRRGVSSQPRVHRDAVKTKDSSTSLTDDLLQL